MALPFVSSLPVRFIGEKKIKNLWTWKSNFILSMKMNRSEKRRRTNNYWLIFSKLIKAAYT